MIHAQITYKFPWVLDSSEPFTDEWLDETMYGHLAATESLEKAEIVDVTGMDEVSDYEEVIKYPEGDKPVMYVMVGINLLENLYRDWKSSKSEINEYLRDDISLEFIATRAHWMHGEDQYLFVDVTYPR